MTTTSVFQQRLFEYRAGPSTGAWQRLCEQFYQLNPGDSFGPCRCGGELIWAKRAHSWLAVCNWCGAAASDVARFSSRMGLADDDDTD
jgi:hypothetical protein